ncbi:major histocompatibility complex class I-related gene protein-like isoform X1 [Aquarana catesbeiana]|uniref:major histocompatibility complex class I-related gene protein-like isoform X1 n=1 Tax=Aquarana catesbeiana TaxID=8400 RepID=UPI003CC9A70F
MKTILTRTMFWRLQIFQACFLFLPTVYAESHSHRRYLSIIPNPIGSPAYSIKVYIDHVELASYSDETRIFQSSLKGNVNAEYWIDLTLNLQNAELAHKHHVKFVNSVLNQTHGENVYQQMSGCTMDGDGKYDGYLKFAQNGKDFIVFDKDQILYIPMTFQTQVIAQHYNKNTAYGSRNKYGLEILCTEQIHSYLKYASFELEKKVPPEVKVWGHLQSDGVTRLYCLVYGFYPRPVDVKWMRNGTDHVPSDEMTPILPHPDGTYQIRVSVEVPTRKGDTYSCHVDHSSLGNETLNVKWEPKKERMQFVAVAVAVVFILIGLGILIYKFRLQTTED